MFPIYTLNLSLATGWTAFTARTVTTVPWPVQISVNTSFLFPVICIFKRTFPAAGFFLFTYCFCFYTISGVMSILIRPRVIYLPKLKQTNKQKHKNQATNKQTKPHKQLQTLIWTFLKSLKYFYFLICFLLNTEFPLLRNCVACHPSIKLTFCLSLPPRALSHLRYC